MNALTNKPVTMSSREIAELTGKRHDNVVRDIRKMLEELGANPLSFEGVYLDAKGESRPCFNLPRREVEILLTGYSIPLRAKVIDRLHELEEQAKGAAFRVPQSLPEALRLAAELAEKNEQLALENKEMAPKAVVFDNCVALRQESLATFVRTLEGVNTMAIKGDLADLGYLYRTVGTSKYRDTLASEKRCLGDPPGHHAEGEADHRRSGAGDEPAPPGDLQGADQEGLRLSS
ncbi:Rha family transcriptional regulator [Stutzerimonas nitrititolerans]|uniref:Rha family transcriptional regulator n=1 Tax=Stutzerimonas nitrititolerans TaxID=2482751 RepID=UPI0028A193C0|nr:Rha family transcriptional regulator [Stutzerimonas nitrititolerans]